MSSPLRRATNAVLQAAGLPGRGGRSRRRGARPDLPTPVSLARVGNDLARRGYRFRTDDDGDITGTWDGNRFWFLLLGEESEILQVRGRWAGAVPDPARPAVLQACNDWNRERIWPKVYARPESAGLALYTEVSVDLEHGATDAQLAETVSCGLVTASQFFSSVGPLTDPSSPS